jgi:hypothetical protein
MDYSKHWELNYQLIFKINKQLHSMMIFVLRTTFLANLQDQLKGISKFNT